MNEDEARVERVAQAICGDDNPANILSIHRVRARAAIAAATAWQPIETAPKDGTRILGYDSEDADDTQPHIVKWLHDPYEPGWYMSWDLTPCNGNIWQAPTHWMPLPDPPK